jgi:regulatory protein
MSTRAAPPPQPPPPDPTGEDREPDQEDIARAIVLKQLAMAPRSRRQLADKLRQRDCPDAVANRLLDRMEAVGLVDDEAYAQMVVRSKQATRGLAKRALAQELRGKGVADATIADALGSIDPESERALAEAVAGRTMRRLAGLEPQVQARRLAGVLGRKGYPPSVVYAVVREAVNDAPEHQRD